VGSKRKTMTAFPPAIQASFLAFFQACEDVRRKKIKLDSQVAVGDRRPELLGLHGGPVMVKRECAYFNTRVLHNVTSRASPLKVQEYTNSTSVSLRSKMLALGQLELTVT
jgi:hypothetical protein